MSINDGNNSENSVEIVKCSSCGADLVFNASSGKLECPYCDNQVGIEIKMSTDRNYFDYTDKGDVDTAGIAFKCPNCNAETVFEDFKTAHPCPFCGATCIVDKDSLPGIKPDSLLPFAITKEQASELGHKWVKKKIFAPSKLKKAFSIDNMQGVYSPCFSFTSDTVSYYEGRVGERYTVTVGSGKNRRTETRIKWYRIKGNIFKVFPNMVIESAQHLDQKQMDKIGPFDIDNSVEFKKDFLAGYSAERYNNSIVNCFGIAGQKMDAVIRRGILEKHHADVVDYLNVNTTYRAVRFKHVLLPLWVCGFTFKEKLYNFFINGRTGRSYGKAPVSPIRVAIASVLGAAAVVGLIFLVKYIGS